MALLPEEQRTAIILKEYHGLTFQEIADLLDCPLSTVKTRLYQGLSVLRKQLHDAGVEEHVRTIAGHQDARGHDTLCATTRNSSSGISTTSSTPPTGGRSRRISRRARSAATSWPACGRRAGRSASWAPPEPDFGFRIVRGAAAPAAGAAVPHLAGVGPRGRRGPRPGRSRPGSPMSTCATADGSSSAPDGTAAAMPPRPGRRRSGRRRRPTGASQAAALDRRLRELETTMRERGARCRRRRAARTSRTRSPARVREILGQSETRQQREFGAAPQPDRESTRSGSSISRRSIRAWRVSRMRAAPRSGNTARCCSAWPLRRINRSSWPTR